MVNVIFFYEKKNKKEVLQKIKIKGHVVENKSTENNLICAGISAIVFGIVNFLTRKKKTEDCQVKIIKEKKNQEFEISFIKNNQEVKLATEILI